MAACEIQMKGNPRQPPVELPLRIAYLLQQFPVPTETFAVSDIASLRALGHYVTVYTMKPRLKGEQDVAGTSAVPAGLSVFRPTFAGVLSWPAKLWKWRREAAWMVKCISEHWRDAPRTCAEAILCLPRLIEISDHIAGNGVDVAHAFWSRHVGLTLPLLERRHSPALRTAFVGAYDLVANDFILDLTTQAADVLFSHAEVNRAFVERKALDGTSVAIIHRGIPLTETSHRKPRDRFRIVTASALVESKNVEAVIRSFAKARVIEPRMKLDVYGEGSDRQRLTKLALELGCSTSIAFRGHIARDALFEQMEGAAVFVLLSKKPSERLPNVVKEALWAGCAVISSPSDGIEELIPDGSIGFVMDPDDPDRIASALLSLVREKPEESAARRMNARAFIEANFSSQSSMRRYADAWRENMRLGESAKGQPSNCNSELNPKSAGI